MAMDWRRQTLPSGAGEVFKTGEKAPVTGDYVYFRLEDEEQKAPPVPNGKRRIFLEEGQELPGHPVNGQPSRWLLGRVLYHKIEEKKAS